ncbi:zinc ribbon domain-containing protein [Candidatus Bathyarchaeota archaeon]|nr:MAG: zinc ribbon domain-containing protein [Candidatus Bathyarchaeota archaeon]TMI72196.1 MAG: zinc ribbon domain-containing protein [Candidatus Bathyarchaeota archaeon]
MKLEVSTQLKYLFSRNPSPGELPVLNCPRCGTPISTPPEREWNFQKYRVSRFRCDNGDKFNLYAGATKTFTIPRPSNFKGFCGNCRTQNPDHAVYCKNCGSKLGL